MGRILLSICAVVVAVGLAGSAQPVQPQQQPPAPSQPAKAAEKARKQRPPIMVTLSEADGESEGDQQQSESDPGRSSPSPWYDLWVQSLMALWAFCQLVLTGVGIWYIRKTLVATEKAVEEAGTATKAAQDAVAVTRDSGERQLRAYIHIDKALLKEFGSGKRPKIVLQIRNAGQTPAHNLTVDTAMVFRTPDHADFTPPPISAAPSVLGPGMTCSKVEQSVDPISAELYSSVIQGKEVLYVFGAVLYCDGFGAERETRFAYRYDTENLSGADAMLICQTGNSAT